MAYLAPSTPQSIGGVLDDWLRLFRESFSRCWMVALIAAAANAYEQFRLIPHMPAPGLPLQEYLMQLTRAYQGPQVFLTEIVFWFVVLVVYGALVVQQLSAVRGGPTRSAGAALSTSLSRLPQMLLGVVLLLLCCGVLGGIIAIAAAVLIPLYHTMGAALLIGLIILAIVIAVIYASVRVQFWLVALFDQDVGGAAAIGRSWRLVEGYWWRTTGILFVAGIVIWVLSLVVSLVAGLMAGLFAASGGPLALLHHLRLVAVISALSQLLTLPLLTAVWTAIYRDLRLRREGTDLSARAEALGS